MLENYAFIGIFFIGAVIFALTPLIGAYLLRPSRPTEIKLDTYECGLEAVGDVWVQFKIQYYMYALSFVIFGIEVVFLFPIALAFGEIGLLAFFGMGLFLVILVFGLIYEWKKGALTWV